MPKYIPDLFPLRILDLVTVYQMPFYIIAFYCRLPGLDQKLM